MKITKQDLAILNVAAQDNIHYSLTHLRVEPGKIIATNGRSLSVREMTKGEKEEFKPFLIKASTLRSIASTGAEVIANEDCSVKIKPTVTVSGKIVEKEYDVTISAPGPTDPKYPQYAQVIPDENRPGITVCISPTEFLKLMKSFEGVREVKMNIAENNPTAPLRFDGVTDDGRKVTGVIMPMASR